MKDCLNKCFIYIFLLLNIIKCQDSDDYINCTKLTIYKNGTFENGTISEYKSKNNTITSIQFNEYFIIYDCMNEIRENSCKFNNENKSNDYYGMGLSAQTCNGKKVSVDDNICCFYRKKFENNTKDDNITSIGCLEVNKYEIQKFSRAFQDNQFDKKNNSYNSSIIEIECNDKINKINKYIILCFLIIFINL